MTNEARCQAVIKSGIRRWLIVHLLAALTMLTLWGLASWGTQRAAQTRTQLESRYQPIKKMKADTKATRERIANLKEQEQLALALAEERPVLTLIGSISDAAQRSGGSLYVQSLDAQLGDVAAKAATTESVVQIRGVGQDDAGIAQFVEILRKQQLFSAVELKSTVAKRQNDTVIRQFHIECTN